MLTEENEAEGLSVYLFAGDSLDDVPESHRGLLTKTLVEVFEDPTDYFLDLADRCPFPNMSAWIRAVVDDEVWAFGLHRSSVAEWNDANFSWWSDTVTSAEIAPSVGLTSEGLPPALAEYYRLVDSVSWMPFGCAGGLNGRAGLDLLSSLDEMYHGQAAGLDPESTYLFGKAPGGDNLISTLDGRGGWMSVGSGQIRLLGTIEETIDWVYGEMLANRSPDLDYNWLRAGS